MANSISGYVISSACSLVATPVSTASTILATTTETTTSGAVLTTTVVGLSTVTDTSTVVITTTINVPAGAPSGTTGYLTFSPGVNPGAFYAVSDLDTHMTDNYFIPGTRENFIVTADGYLYSVSHDAYYFIRTDPINTLLYWSHVKAEAMPIFTGEIPDASGNFRVLMTDTSTGLFYGFCLSTLATTDRNRATGYHFHGYKSGNGLPSTCQSVTLSIEAV